MFCCSPLVVPVVRGEVGHGYCQLFFVFSLHSSFFSHCVLCRQSPIPIFCCGSPFSSSFRSLTLSSHGILCHPRFPQFSGHLLSAYFSSPILFTCPAHFTLLLASFFLKFLHSNLHSQFVHSSLVCSLHYYDSSFLVVFTNVLFLLFLY